MTRMAPPQYALSAGEISPRLRARPDYARRQQGLRAAVGFVPLTEGGVTRAPGSLHRGEALSHAAKSRLVPFEFARDDAMVLEFSPLLMSPWRYGARVQKTGADYTIVTPFTADNIAAMQWEQSADFIYIATGEHPLKALTRSALDDWNIEDALIRRGPFMPLNTNTARSIQSDDDQGTVTLTATANIFEADHVGGLFKLEEESSNTATWTGNESVVTGNRMRNAGRVYKVTAGTNTGANPPTHTRGARVLDKGTGITWEYFHDSFGVVEITGYTSPTEVTAQVKKRLPRGVVEHGTSYWAEGAWSDKNGYPACVAIVDQRLVCAATTASPRTMWFSALGDFTDFEPRDDADAAFAYTVGGGRSRNRITWLKGLEDGVAVGALGEEYSGASTNSDRAIAAGNLRLNKAGSTGSHDRKPVDPFGSPVFVSADRRRVMEMRFSFEQDRRLPVELSLPSAHLGAALFDEIAHQASPTSLSWLTTATGHLVAMVQNQPEEVLGWAPVPVAGGVVESICVTPSPTGAEDVVTLAVRRSTGAGDVRHIEELAPIWGAMEGDAGPEEAVHLYAAVEFTPGVPTTDFTGLPIPGAEVWAWTDAGGFGPFTVDGGGAVELPEAVTRAVIGLHDDTHVAETLDLLQTIREGSALGRVKKARQIGVHLHRTAALKSRPVERRDGERLRTQPGQEFVRKSVLPDAPVMRDGAHLFTVASAACDEATYEFIPQPGAPATILAIAPTGDVTDG